MKLTAKALLLWTCVAAASVSVKATTSTVIEDDNGASQLLEVLIGLQMHLDHNEVDRILSSYASSPKDHEREQLKVDKEAVLLEAKAYIEPCLRSFQSSIKEHNDNNNDGKRDIELTPFSKDGSLFHLTGSAKDFAMFFEKRDDKNNDGKEQLEISTATYKLPEILAECVGFVGTFRHLYRNDDKPGRRHDSQDHTTNTNMNRILKSTTPDTSSGTCPNPNSFFEQYAKKDLTTGYCYPWQWFCKGPAVPAAHAHTIRNIYGVPEVSGECYHPRDSAVFEFGSKIISRNDLKCYTQYNGLPDTEVIGFNKEGTAVPGGGVGVVDDCNGKACGEPNLDVQMLSAMGQGTTIMALTGLEDDNDVDSYDRMLKKLKNLGDNKEKVPAVVSISYGINEKEIVEGQLTENAQHICNEIQLLSFTYGITFFASSGDHGAGNIGPDTGGRCGDYAPQFPASCPYVTAVGGSFGTIAGKEKLSDGNHKIQGNNIVSGGGFSTIFTTENKFTFTYQQSHVSKWLKNKAAKNSIKGYELANGAFGAAYPDVSALSANVLFIENSLPNSASGTSASAPIFAGIVNLCASQLPGDVHGFGLINHILYKAEELFFDIEGGNNQYGITYDNQYYCNPVCDATVGTCTNKGTYQQECECPNPSGKFYGFEATKGWDPASGLGTLGTIDPYDDTKGFLGLCNALLAPHGKQWVSKNIKCDKKTKKVKKVKDKKVKEKKGTKYHI